jgi:hypothetical protein
MLLSVCLVVLFCQAPTRSLARLLGAAILSWQNHRPSESAQAQAGVKKNRPKITPRVAPDQVKSCQLASTHIS